MIGSEADRFLVTGGTGLVGSRVARLLLAAGARVRVLYLPGTSVRNVEGLDVEHAPADLLDGAAVARALEGVDAVFHTAALVTFKPGLYEQQRRVNVEGTRVLLEALGRGPARRLVYTSTVNTLGVPPPGRVGDEDTPFDWGPYRLGYMDSKRAAEDLVLAAVGRGLDAVVVLPGTLLGPGDVNFNAGSYVRVVARLPLPVAMPGGTTLAHVDDVAAGHLLALERGRSGRRYILGGTPATYRELFGCIARELGRPARAVTLPARPLRGLGRLGSALAGRFGLALPLEGLVRAVASELYYSSARAERELGWTFRPVEEAVRDAVRWYREEGLL